MAKTGPKGPRIYTNEYLDVLAASLMTWARSLAKAGQFGLIGDWCFANDFNPKAFGRHIENHEGFKEAYEYARSWQEHCVAKGALEKDFDARFATFFLGCNHQWKTQTSTDAQITLINDFAKFNANMALMHHSCKEDEEK